MDDLSQKLNSILSDPESMEQLRRMADGLFGGTAQAEAPAPQASPAIGGLPDLGELGSLAAVLSKLKAPAADSRTALITALRPHLSPKRQERADRAIRILHLLDILPLLRESGLLEKLL